MGCHKVCKSKSGLTLHRRRSKKPACSRAYFAEFLVAHPIKRKSWSKDEIILVCLKEVELLDKGANPRFILGALHQEFPGRPYDSLKAIRYSTRYKEELRHIRQNSREIEAPPESRDAPASPVDMSERVDGLPAAQIRPLLVEAVGSPIIQRRVRTRADAVRAQADTVLTRAALAERCRNVRRSLEVGPRAQADAGEAEAEPDVNRSGSPESRNADRNNSCRSWTLGLKAAILSTLLITFNVESLDPGTFQGAQQNQHFVDSDMNDWLPSLPTRPLKIRGQAPLPIHPRKRKRAIYGKLQYRYRVSRGACADSVLNGSYEKENPPLDFGRFHTYWSGLFSKSSVSDERPFTPVRDTQWDLLDPITETDVKEALRSMDVNTAAGLDGYSLTKVRQLPPQELATRFNSWLLAGTLPTKLCEGYTVLIPKVHGSEDPADYRPITIGSIVARCFHKILAGRLERLCPCSLRQKAFRAGDGVCLNVEIAKGILDSCRRPKAQRNCYMAFLDVRKAFDSVSHESLMRAASRQGVPEPLIRYIHSVYSNSTTKLRIGGRESGKIPVRQGVKQGDPMSPILFNFVIDWALADLNPRMGYSLGNERINHLAFADDVVLVSESVIGLQAQVHSFEKHLLGSGLTLNPGKCKSLSNFVVGGRCKRRNVTSRNPIIKVGGKYVGALGLEETYKYLGISFDVRGVTYPGIETKLDGYLRNLSRAPLKPQQRLWMLQHKVLPSLYHGLVLAHVSLGFLENLDRRVRQRLRAWLKLPHDTPIPFFYTDAKEGGLGVVRLRGIIPPMKARRFENLLATDDPVGMACLERKRFQDMLGKWISICQSDGVDTRFPLLRRQAMAEGLYASVDGCGLKTAGLCPKVNDWPLSGNLLLDGRRFIGALSIRGNLLATPSRRARRIPDDRGICDACGGDRRGTLAHILQSCPRTHGLRVKRHDRVTAQVARQLGHRGYCTIAEPKVKTTLGLRKPDLVAWSEKRAKCIVLDTTIITDNPDTPDGPHWEKVEKYGSIPEIQAFAQQVSGLTHVEYSSVTINWRGLFSPKSAEDLRSYGLSLEDLKLLAQIVCEKGYGMWASWTQGTARNGRPYGTRDGWPD